MSCTCKKPASNVPRDPVEAMAQSRHIMQETGHWSENQQMGRRWAVGCVALEITQRCNLDCTLCYLSEHSEAVKDIPLSEIFKRIDDIYEYYGPYTDIQVTGGDPTLRKRGELLAIIRRIHEKKMRSTLMTNGIKLSRSLMQELAHAGLDDVALHVDTTQQRTGYDSEKDLHELRQYYIEQCRDTGVSIFFNTTIHSGNFHEIPDLVRFFIRHADKLRTVSFQLQADTGRGTLRKRTQIVTPDSVWHAIETAAGTKINFNAIQAGHPSCNRYGMCLVVNHHAYDVFDDPGFVGKFHMATAHLIADRRHPLRTARQFLSWFCRHPGYAWPFVRWGAGKFRNIARDLLLARGQANTLSFFMHNFMDASELDAERIKACVFKTMTPDGPMSMCQYNACRDNYILQPLPVKTADVIQFWHPLSGEMNRSGTPVSITKTESYPLKRLKGRSRKTRLQNSG